MAGSRGSWLWWGKPHYVAVGQLHKDRGVPAHRAENIRNPLACVEFETSFTVVPWLLLQITVKVTLVFQWGGWVYSSWGSSFNPHFYFLHLLHSTTWVPYGRKPVNLRMRKKHDWWCQNTLIRWPDQQLLNPLGVSACYDGSSLSTHPSNSRGAGDA